MEPSIILKPGKEKAILNKHHWIFSGATASFPKGMDGACVPVVSADKKHLGFAYLNSQVTIVGRMVSFDETPPLESIKNSLKAALELRKNFFNPQETNGYRLINGEGDRLPGLVVDKYDDVLVIQILTLGMDKLRSLIVDFLVAELNPRTIYEKSTQGSRRDEGLDSVEKILYGEDVETVEILENGMKFLVAIKEGQKTGFFLDQREMRDKIRRLAAGKKVLNCFSYTGGFSINALKGGASQVLSVDKSASALALAERNVALNNLPIEKHQTLNRDVFEFLRKEPLDYALVILDPPAFAKGKKDVVQACRGYKDLNRVAMQKMPAGSILLTCSCSAHIETELFQKVVFQAAAEAKRHCQIIGRHELALDHPINIFHPETDYLKSLLVYIS